MGHNFSGCGRQQKDDDRQHGAASPYAFDDLKPIIMIDVSLSAPIMIIVGSTMRGFREIGAFGLDLHR